METNPQNTALLLRTSAQMLRAQERTLPLGVDIPGVTNSTQLAAKLEELADAVVVEAATVTAAPPEPSVVPPAPANEALSVMTGLARAAGPLISELARLGTLPRR